MTEFGRGAFWEELSFAGLRIAKAWEMLNGGKIGHLNVEQYMQLCRDAGYDEGSVQKAGTAWANKILDAKSQA